MLRAIRCLVGVLVRAGAGSGRTRVTSKVAGPLPRASCAAHTAGGAKTVTGGVTGAVAAFRTRAALTHVVHTRR